MNNKTRWIATTGIMLALLIVLQAVTGFGGQFLTGSCVNLVLAVSAIVGGLWCGVTVALLSPFFAFLLGIGPKLIQIVPCIALGNVVFVIALYLLASFKAGKALNPIMQRYGAAVISAGLKFLTLWVVIVKLVLPSLGLPEAQVNTMSAMFSWPQLVTALIGGCIAVTLLPILRKIRKPQEPRK